ncbi:hypothetical protein [Silanimonas lenta]|uniref:hypothetical protein n=1 Tax=Silanimonas lenta TaxID=265429 RepID=UPI00041FF90A|nr:hypothetical protein [Silanimonas lenta]
MKTLISGLRPAPPLVRSLLAGLVLFSATAHAARPLITDDAAVVEAGTCQIEAWIEGRRGDSTRWLSPGCALPRTTELAIGIGRGFAQDAPRRTELAWQLKTLLIEGDEGLPHFAFALGGGQARGLPAREWFATGIASLPLAEGRRFLHLNLGLFREREDEAFQTGVRGAVALDQSIGDTTWLSAEAFASEGERAGWQLGLRRELASGRVQLDASGGSRFGRWNDTRQFSVGFVIAGLPFLR